MKRIIHIRGIIRIGLSFSLSFSIVYRLVSFSLGPDAAGYRGSETEAAARHLFHLIAYTTHAKLAIVWR